MFGAPPATKDASSSGGFSFGGASKPADASASIFGNTPTAATGGFSFGAGATTSAPAAGSLFGGSAPAAAAAAPGAAGGGDEDGVAPLDESEKDDAPVVTALNEGEEVEVEQRCKAFVWGEVDDDSKPLVEGQPKPTKPGWSDRGVYVTRVVKGKGYGSLVVKQEAAPFKILSKDGQDDQGNIIGGVNFKITSKIPVNKSGKTLNLMLPGKAGAVSKYLLRYKDQAIADKIHNAIETHKN